MEQLSLAMFGRFRVVLGDEKIPAFRTQKVAALLALLAAEPAVVWRREELMTLLWPGMPDASARQNLRQVLYHLRRSIPGVRPRSQSGEDAGVPLVLADRHTMQLNPAADVSIDTAAFDELVSRSRAHDHAHLHTCGACSELLASALSLYGGDFLADFYLEDSNEFEAWAEATRQAYRRKVMDTLGVLTKNAMQRKAYTEARLYADRLLQMDNLDEYAYRQKMEALARDGRRHEALAVYEKARRLLREELGMAPAAATTRLAQQIENDALDGGEPPRESVRGYQLLDKIGVGAFGVVHRAYQPVIGREVVIKIIRPRYANHPDFIRRFETEAQTIARLEHPYIVPLYDFWREPDNAFLVMRWLRGGNLEERLQEGPLAPHLAATVVDQIAGALYAAHRQHIIHRDVKAANILLDEDNNAYLSDFSVAKDLRIAAQPANLESTMAYLSPEQLLGEELSPRTDQYSLGIVIYQMLTGISPFLDGSTAEILRRYILGESLPLVAAQVPGIPGAIDDVIQRATAKKPGDRFPDMIALARSFHQAAGTAGAATNGEAVASEAMTAEPGIVLNPYMGLRAFQESDAGAFFGREALVQRLLARIERDHGARFLSVVGPSGSGKSSVVKAGLIPALRGGAVPGSEKWFISEMTPGRDPLQELAAALMRVAVDPPADLLPPLLHDPRGLINVLQRILPAEGNGHTPQLLLLIDQLEELFTLTTDDGARDFFISSLLAALNEPAGRLRVVTTLRADFYDRPLQVQTLGELLRRRTEVVLPLTPAELEQAIARPAALAGVSLEPGLTAMIAAGVIDQPGTLPLLQYALTELFDRREKEAMTLAAYEAIGGVSGALGRRADEIYQGLSPLEQEAARQLFLRLVTLGEGSEDTRRRVLREELEALAVDSKQYSVSSERLPVNNDQSAASVTHSELPRGHLVRIPHSDQSEIPNPKSQISYVIDLFGQYRLLTFDRDPATRGPTVEVAHEALLRAWPRLRAWLDESRADMRLQRLLAGETAEWLQSGRDARYLLRGARLDQYAGWPETATLSLTEAEKAFLAAGFAARKARLAEEEARRRRELDAERQHAEEQKQAAEKLRRRALILTGALAVAAIMAITAFFFADQARSSAQTAGENARLAATSAAQAAANEQEALANEARAEENAAVAATRESQALTEAAIRATAQGEAAAQRDVALAKEREALTSYSLALAANARQALAADDQPLALLLALAANGVEAPPLEAWRTLLDVAYAPGAIRAYDVGSAVNAVAVAPDGRSILSGSDDGLIRVWSVDDGSLLQVLEGHDDAVSQLAFSPDGALILSGGADGSLRLWDAAAGTVERKLVGHRNWISGVAFLPDGRALSSEDPDLLPGELILWDLQTGEIINRFGTDLEEQVEGVRGLTVSPDGLKALVGYGTDSETGSHPAALWNIESGEVIHFLEGPVLSVNSVSITQDGQLGLGAADDTSLYIWDLETGELLQSLTEHEGQITAVGAAPNGVTALTGSLDGAIINLDLTRGQVIGQFFDHQDGVSAIAYLDNERAVSGSYDGTVRIWDLNGRWLLERWRDPELPQDHIQNGLWLSGDGRFALSQSHHFPTFDDLMLTLWDYETGDVVRRIGPLDSYIEDLAISDDGRQALTANGDGSLTLWDLQSGQVLKRLDGELESITNVDISENGRFAVARSLEEIIYWDLLTGEMLRSMTGQLLRANIGDVRFLPGSKQAVSGGADGTLVVWDLQTGEQIKRLSGLEGDAGSHLFAEGLAPPFINKVAVAADGRHLLSAGEDGTLIWWDLASGRSLRQFLGHAHGVRSVALSPDGHWALSGAHRDPMILWDVSTGKPIRRYHFARIPDANFFPVIAVHASGDTALTDNVDGSILKWQLSEPAPSALIDWLSANRALREMTCLERETYRIEPLCQDGRPLETTAALLTRARSAVEDLDIEPAAPALPSADDPLLAPPEREPQTAVLGENRGELTRGDFDVWTYEGLAGEVIGLQMIADRPLSDRTTPIDERYAAGVLDTALKVIGPDGRLLDLADDDTTVDLQRLSDARILALRLPQDGLYRIEARSALDDHAGPYTLLIEQLPAIWHEDLYQEYSGHYLEGPWQADFMIFLDDGRFYGAYLGDRKGWEWVPLSETEFAIGGSSRARMLRDDEGAVSGFEILYGYDDFFVGGQWYEAQRVDELPPDFIQPLTEETSQLTSPA